MAEVKEENGVIHIYLKETLKVEEKKRKRGRDRVIDYDRKHARRLYRDEKS